MILIMKNKTQVSQRWIQDEKTGLGHCRLTFHGYGNRVVDLPVGHVPTLGEVVLDIFPAVEGEKKHLTYTTLDRVVFIQSKAQNK